MNIIDALPDEAKLKKLPDPGETRELELPEHDGWRRAVHELDRRQALAIHTALSTRRPLLIRGEPGTGKTQLARAAAKGLLWHFAHRTMDARTEVSELFWKLDAVGRLAEAQIMGPTNGDRSKLDLLNFVEPGLFWWGFNWAEATGQQATAMKKTEEEVAKSKPPAPWLELLTETQRKKAGSVILVDEIDKADPFLPDALLEVLGTGRFDGPAGKFTLKPTRDILVVITTNRQRALSAAFMRRCVVLDLVLDPKQLVETFVRRGELHMNEVWKKEQANGEALSKELFIRAAERIQEQRARLEGGAVPLPGQDEFLALAQALYRLRTTNAERETLLEEVLPFVLDKHAEGASL